MATPHNEAKIGDIATTVLMPGDPMRAKFIAEHYLKDATQFNDVRGMLGYTGFYNGKKVSVMGSGMGIPSMGIYSYELFKFYGVMEIIRIGSCGALLPDIKLFDVVLVDSAYSDSTYALVHNGDKRIIINASPELNEKIEKKILEEGIKVRKGNVYTTDVFTPYCELPEPKEVSNNHCIVSDMETFALFHNALCLNKKAASLLSVSDSAFIEEKATSEQREQEFTKMIELALKSI